MTGAAGPDGAVAGPEAAQPSTGALTVSGGFLARLAAKTSAFMRFLIMNFSFFLSSSHPKSAKSMFFINIVAKWRKSFDFSDIVESNHRLPLFSITSWVRS
jgi:hypothetical protein